MADRGISISIKLILSTTLLILAVVSLFGLINRIQTRKTIDQSSARLKDELARGMDTAGRAQLQLLRETTRTTLSEGHKETLQTIVQDTAKWDNRIAAVAVINPAGNVVAHSDPQRTGTEAGGVLRQANTISDVEVQPNVELEGIRVMTFSAPVSSGSIRLCTIFIAFHMAPLEQALAKNEELKARADSASLRSNLSIGALAVLVGLLLAIIMGVRLTRPIQALALQVDRMASGDLEGRVRVDSHDEIGLLGERFNHMADVMLRLFHDSQGKATMEKELTVASAIQATLIPERQTVKLKGMELAGHFRPATHCGGDWWNFFRLQGDRTLVLVGDATGHGVGSAMITAAAQGSVSALLASSDNKMELSPLLQAMNAAIHATARGKFVMTCFASIFDPATRTLFYANAGHNFAYHYQGVSRKLTSMVVRGNRLGDLATCSYEVKEMKLRPGDVIFWYTDGIIECANAAGEEYGDKRFREVAQRVAMKPAQTALEALVHEATAFYGEVSQQDDITLVVGRVS